jgi:phage baseplate assembly protein W
VSHARFNFKSSGILVTDRRISEPTIVKNPIGIKTPLEFGTNEDSLFKMHFNPGDQVKDNLRNLVLTNFGERLGRANFGANLKDISFDLTAIEQYESEVAQRIRDTVNTHLPIVEIRDISTQDVSNARIGENNFNAMRAKSSGLALIVIRIKYDISRVKIFDQALEVLTYVGG